MADGRITIDTKVDDSGAKKGLSNLENTLKDTAKKAERVGRNLTKYVTAPILALGGIALAAANDIDSAYKDIQIGTGATGDELDDLKDSFDEVFTNVPNSADEVAGSLAGLNTMTGATGEVLEGLSQNVLDASRMLDENGVESSEAFGRAMAQWNIPAEEGEEHLDKLFVATQEYGIGLGEVSGLLTNYGSVLQNAGFSMDESADLFGRLHSEGINVSRIMPGLNSAFRNWAKEGKDSQKELDKVINSMQEAESETEALAIATDVFGAEGAQRMTTAVRNGALSLDDLGDALNDSQGAISETNDETQTLGDRFGILKNETMAALQPMGEVLLDLAEEWMPKVRDAIQIFAEWLSELSPVAIKVGMAIGALVAVIGPLLIAFNAVINVFFMILPILKLVGAGIALLTSPITWVIAAVVALGAAIFFYWDEIKEITTIVFTFLGDFFVGIWEWIKDIWNNSITWLSDVINGAWNWISETTENVWNGIKDFFESIWSGIEGIFNWYIDTFKKIISGAWDFIKNTTSTVWNGIKSFFDGLWDNLIKGVNKMKDLFIKAWDAVKNGVKAVVNPIIGFINAIISAMERMVNALGSAVNAIPSFDVPSWIPGIGGSTFGLPEIPKVSIPRIPSLDVGTDMVMNDGLAMIHKGEKIVPADVAGGGYSGDGKNNIHIKAIFRMNDQDFPAIVEMITEEQRWQGKPKNEFA